MQALVRDGDGVARLEWSESWSVGDPQLDEEHRGLVALINRLQEPCTPQGVRRWRRIVRATFASGPK